MAMALLEGRACPQRTARAMRRRQKPRRRAWCVILGSRTCARCSFGPDVLRCRYTDMWSVEDGCCISVGSGHR